MAEIGGFKNWLTYLRVRGLRAERKAEARPKFVRWLAREWRLTTHATLARMRGDTIVFEIGTPFLMSECIWICTDVGTRTICAVKLDELIESGDSGPPYSIVEDVFDGYDMGGCQLIR